MKRPSDPIARFRALLVEVSRQAPFDPTAMTLATASRDGRPSARIVLLKGVDASGFSFFTNYESRKGRELNDNPYAALCAYWPWAGRQVRIEGRVERLAEAESDAYFATRPRGHQLGAWASRQTEPLGSRAALFHRLAAGRDRYAGRAVPRPKRWGGFRLCPDRIEFWHARLNRLHDRLLFRRSAEGWVSESLQP